MPSVALLLIGLLLLLAGAVVAAVVLIGGESRGVARSLALIDEVSRDEVAANDLAVSDRLVTPAVALIRRGAARLAPGSTLERLGHNLELAGNPAGWTVERLLALKGLGLIVGALLGLVFFHAALGGVPAAVLMGALVYFVPDLLAYNAGIKRQEALRLGLSDALDLLTLCVEAGQAFNAAMLQVSRSVGGPVSQELGRVLAEIQIGKSRHDAFADFAARTTAPEIRTFVTSMTQADRLGLPLGGVLREQAKEMRIVRRQVAEEKAQKVPVKILFPMLFFIFPALFVVLLGPGVIQIIAGLSRL